MGHTGRCCTRCAGQGTRLPPLSANSNSVRAGLALCVQASEEERSAAEVQFKLVGEAYSVLSDANKRARYDQGAQPVSFVPNHYLTAARMQWFCRK